MSKQNRPIPNELWPPKVMQGYETWMDTFWELSTDRQIGMDVGEIPGSAIAKRMEHFADPLEADLFRQCIRAMDKAYLEIGDGSSAPQKLTPELLAAQGKKNNVSS